MRHQTILPAEPAPGVTTESRLERIRESNDIGWLRRVVFWTDYPVSVRAAADLRLRRIQRAKAIK
jgi:hypothetical protein